MSKIQRLAGNLVSILKSVLGRDFVSKHELNFYGNPLILMQGIDVFLANDSTWQEWLDTVFKDLPRTKFMPTPRETLDDGFVINWTEDDIVSAWMKDSAIDEYAQGYTDGGIFKLILDRYRFLDPTGPIATPIEDEFRFAYFDDEGQVCTLSISHIAETPATPETPGKPAAWVAAVTRGANLRLEQRQTQLIASPSLDLLRDPETLDQEKALRDFYHFIGSKTVTQTLEGFCKSDGNLDHGKLEKIQNQLSRIERSSFQKEEEVHKAIVARLKEEKAKLNMGEEVAKWLASDEGKQVKEAWVEGQLARREAHIKTYFNPYKIWGEQQDTSLFNKHSRKVYQALAVSLIIASGLLVFAFPVEALVLCFFPILVAIKRIMDQETAELRLVNGLLSEREARLSVNAVAEARVGLENSFDENQAPKIVEKQILDPLYKAFKAELQNEEVFNLTDFFFEDDEEKAILAEKSSVDKASDSSIRVSQSPSRFSFAGEIAKEKPGALLVDGSIDGASLKL